MTESVSGPKPPDSLGCRHDAQSFARDGLQFLAHYGPQAAYPADLYYVILRGVFADFQAHRCDGALLGDALDRRLTAKQRGALIADLPRPMDRVIRAGLARTR
jgi:hypothetical protein